MTPLAKVSKIVLLFYQPSKISKFFGPTTEPFYFCYSWSKSQLFFCVTSQLKFSIFLALQPIPNNLAIPGQYLSSLGQTQKKLAILSFCVTSKVKFPNFSAQLPIPIYLATSSQNTSSLGQPLPMLGKLSFFVTSQVEFPIFQPLNLSLIIWLFPFKFSVLQEKPSQSQQNCPFVLQAK